MMKRKPKRKFVVGVIGSGDANDVHEKCAYQLGKLIAKEGWVVLSGGRDAGVMDAVNKGAKSVKTGFTVGVLPTSRSSVSDYVDVAIFTDMNNARNNINVLSSNVVVACGVEGAGTASEVALAIKAHKRVIIIGGTEIGNAFFKEIGNGLVSFANTPTQAINMIKNNPHAA